MTIDECKGEEVERLRSSEVRGRRSEVRGQRAEIRGRRADDGIAEGEKLRRAEVQEYYD